MNASFTAGRGPPGSWGALGTPPLTGAYLEPGRSYLAGHGPHRPEQTDLSQVIAPVDGPRGQQPQQERLSRTLPPPAPTKTCALACRLAS